MNRARSVLAPALLGCLLLGCSSAPPLDVGLMVKEWAQYMQRDYIIRPGDRIVVTVYPEAGLTQELTVPPHGSVHLARIEEGVRAVGLSIAAFQELVREAYLDVLTEAEVTVSLVEASAKTVYVTGEVGRGGPQPYTPGLTAVQAIAGAGGLLTTAKWSDVRVLRATGSPEMRTQRLDVAAVLHDAYPDFVLLPGDVVYCQTSGIADVANFLDLYLWRLLPFRNIGSIAAF